MPAGRARRAVSWPAGRPGIPLAVATGLTIELPPGYEAQVRPRSGLALKHAITMPKAPATIDPGYLGEIKVILLNLGRENYELSFFGEPVAVLFPIALQQAVAFHLAQIIGNVRRTYGEGRLTDLECRPLKGPGSGNRLPPTWCTKPLSTEGGAVGFACLLA